MLLSPSRWMPGAIFMREPPCALAARSSLMVRKKRWCRKKYRPRHRDRSSSRTPTLRSATRDPQCSSYEARCDPAVRDARVVMCEGYGDHERAGLRLVVRRIGGGHASRIGPRSEGVVYQLW